jgi:hypothetical protein
MGSPWFYLFVLIIGNRLAAVKCRPFAKTFFWLIGRFAGDNGRNFAERNEKSMYEDAIRFSFPDPRAAYDAFDILQELGYEPVIDEEGEHPTLHIHIEGSDVRSALEIAQVYGGELVESGFHSGGLGIPAHTVTEDFTDGYLSGLSQAYLGDEAETLRDGYRDSVYE